MRLNPAGVLLHALFLSALSVLPACERAQAMRPPRTANALTTSVHTRVDVKASEIVIEAGPFYPNDHPAPAKLTFPADGWIHGYRVRLVDATGAPVDPKVLHHLLILNYSRRQLINPISERIAAVGSETGDVEVPKRFGAPVSADYRLGIYAVFNDSPARANRPVHVIITFLWTPADDGRPPRDVLPAVFDVISRVGVPSAYDLPPGMSQRSFEFEMPVSGRLLQAGGHLHDHAVALRLEDAATSTALVEIDARRDAGGRIIGVERKLVRPLRGGVPLERGRRYRIIAIYDSPLADTLVDGAMGHFVGAFAPDRIADWPAVDTLNADYRADLATVSTANHRHH